MPLFKVKLDIDWRSMQILPQNRASYKSEKVLDIRKCIGDHVASMVTVQDDYDYRSDTNKLQSSFMIMTGPEWRILREKLMAVAYKGRRDYREHEMLQLIAEMEGVQRKQEPQTEKEATNG